MSYFHCTVNILDQPECHGGVGGGGSDSGGGISSSSSNSSSSSESPSLNFRTTIVLESTSSQRSKYSLSKKTLNLHFFLNVTDKLKAHVSQHVQLQFQMF